MSNVRALRRWSATAAAAAALGVLAGSGALALPAHAAGGSLEIRVTNGNVQGKPGDKVNVGFEITNRTQKAVKANEVVVGLSVPAQQAQLDPADYQGCGAISGGRSVRCRPSGDIEAGKKITGSFKIVLKGNGSGSGTIAVQPGNSDRFTIRVSGASPSKTPSGKASRSSSADPTTDVEVAPPEAGNGAIPQAENPPKTRTSDSGGLSFGFWVGIVAILAALGLVGSLFYFRRKDRQEPDTGMHPVVPAPAGYGQPGAPQGFRPPTPTTYGSPAGGYGGSSAATTVIPNPQGGMPPGYGMPPAPAAPPMPPSMPPGPGSNDQTVIFRRPGDV